MIQANIISRLFTKVKPLKISVEATQPSLKIKSLTTNQEWQVNNALQNVLASLVACQLATMKDLIRKQKFKIQSVKFTKVESSYDLSKYIKGGPDNKINDVTIQAQVETTGTQQDLDALHKKVQKSCPVYQMISGSGVKITNTWKNIQKK